MVLLGFWAFVALQSPGPGLQSPQLLMGLAAVAVALLVALAVAGMTTPRPLLVRRVRAVGAEIQHLPRSLDPDAAGRPRPRAPSPFPVIALS
ncbi:hypothetical protein GCM10010435_15090 [Winogradskya consettensis]|uniref:Uncharacterized protein n=1 Tax=Winogradskya consettensis TaxID=113560 RepID=A0A919SCI8_9ACTN|nr:DUF6412 domain-containing protein [Actinoplanes consettensis]GIM69238.1 hypothetical protein Aco04nite_14360 [Actinoplanes consettensis]